MFSEKGHCRNMTLSKVPTQTPVRLGLLVDSSSRKVGEIRTSDRYFHRWDADALTTQLFARETIDVAASD
jgi:hypothetical protein